MGNAERLRAPATWDWTGAVARDPRLHFDCLGTQESAPRSNYKLGGWTVVGWSASVIFPFSKTILYRK
jgi:hypothetical protein